jgi:tetratricopeptide (TPR) repeat protein
MISVNKPTRERVVRVFISSTFRDMQVERDILIKKVFPQLRKLCEERAVSWTEVDLRWGITTEEVSEGKVLPLCLAEIQRCRPYFIGLLGERYGWVPEEQEFPEGLLEAHLWLKEHREHSVTEMEILHGVLRNPAMADHSLFYFRDPDYINHLPDGSDPADFVAESSFAAKKLADLKERIRTEHATAGLHYKPRENYPDPDALGELVLADFTSIIDKLYPKTDIPDPLDQEAMRHDAYAASRRVAFIGRGELLRQMDEHISVSGALPLVLTGESGCGKSSLLAEWSAHWRAKNPEDLVIQHFIGSTSKSADWQGLVRRILGELKRAFSIDDELPEKLRAALQEWLTKAAGKRRVVLVIDALNQISTDDPAAKQLGWLPFAIPPNVRLLVSSLSGETLESLRKRNWYELKVPLFGSSDIVSAAEAYFNIYSKKLPGGILAKLEATPAANPLYLRSVLDELRQFGRHEELEAKAKEYLEASDLSSLFDRILTRWDEDFGRNPVHPDLVRRTLCLVACSRFGLSEKELLDLLGTAHELLPRRYWTPLYLAAENAMAQQSGLLTFGHEYLRTAVLRRWLQDDTIIDQFRLHLADYFGSITEPTDRKLDEFPALLQDTMQWERLKVFLADLPTFLRLRGNKRWKWELHGYWLALEGCFDPVDVYLQVLSSMEPDLTREHLSYLFQEVASFHKDAGRYTGAEPLYLRALEVLGGVLGQEHPKTLSSVNNLALFLASKGDYAGAEPLHRRALQSFERVLGPEHPDTLGSVNNLALLLANMGDYASAEPLYRRALEVRERVLGPEHPDTLGSMNNLACLLESRGDYAGAEPLYHCALEAREQVLGPEHPETVISVSTLAGLLHSKGEYVGAELLHRRALESFERMLGPEHPDTLTSMCNLAALLKSKGDYEGAEPLFRRALESFECLLGPEHPETLTNVNNLACLLEIKGDYAGAELLYRRVLEIFERVLGPTHSHTLGSVNNLAGLLERMGDYPGAEPLFRHALKVRKQVLGPEHPDTLNSVSNLAGLLYSKGDYASAEPLFRLALKVRKQVLGTDHPDTLIIMNNLAFLLLNKGDSAGAEPLFSQVVVGLFRISQEIDREHPNFQTAVGNYVRLLMQTGLSQEQAVIKIRKTLRL